jgi:hypothetical protein
MTIFVKLHKKHIHIPSISLMLQQSKLSLFFIIIEYKLTHTYCIQKTNANLWCLEHEQTCIHNHQTSKHKLKHTPNDISFQSEIKNLTTRCS